MDEVIKAIEQAAYTIPAEWGDQPTSTGVPYAYSQGLVAGRRQALDIIYKYIQDKCSHAYGDEIGRCLKCGFLDNKKSGPPISG